MLNTTRFVLASTATLAITGTSSAALLPVVLFEQDFSAGSSSTNYVDSSGVPNKFTGTGFSANVSFADGRLALSRPANSTAYAARAANLAPTDLSVLALEFDFNYTGTNSITDAVDIKIGDGFGNSTTDDATGTHAVRQRINLAGGTTPNQWSIGGSSFTGEQRIRIIANTSGALLNYTSPANSAASVASNTYDLYVGNTLISDDAAVVTPGRATNEFKFRFNTNATAGGTITFDNIVVSTIPEPASAGVLLGLGALGALRRRRR